jgi:hypothetical protein
MKSHDIGKQVKERWDEFDRLWREGHYYSALLRVAEVYSCREKLPPQLRQQYESGCQGVRIDVRILDSVRSEIAGTEERILRILSVGTKWNMEELLLVVTLAIQIDLLLRYLNDRGFGLRSEGVEKCVTAIRQVAGSVNNQKAYDSAAA